MLFGEFLKAVLPPILTRALTQIKRAALPPSYGLIYAPEGWQTAVPAASGAESESFRAHLRDQWERVWEPFVVRLNDQGMAAQTLTGPRHVRIEEHSSWMTYAYILALAAQRKSSLKILDYGGGLGYFYWVGKALLPGIDLEYHCKEMPALVREGMLVTPGAVWHMDDACLEEEYDLVVLSSVLEYVEDWQALLERASRATQSYVYLAATPVVDRVSSYVAIQRYKGTTVRYRQFNKAELQKACSAAGLQLAREFLEGDHEPILNAPEQPYYYGCLLQRVQGAD